MPGLAPGALPPTKPEGVDGFENEPGELKPPVHELGRAEAALGWPPAGLELPKFGFGHEPGRG